MRCTNSAAKKETARLLGDRQKDDADDVQEPFAGERLFDKEVATGLETASLVVAGIFAGEEYNGDIGGLGVLFQLVADLVTVHDRQHDVEQDQVGAELLGALDPPLGGVFHGDIVSGGGQKSIDDLRDFRLIVDDQDSRVLGQHDKGRSRVFRTAEPSTCNVGLPEANLTGIAESAPGLQAAGAVFGVLPYQESMSDHASTGHPIPREAAAGSAETRADLLGLTPAEIGAHLSGIGEPSYRGLQVANWVYRHGVSDFGLMSNLGRDLRERLAAEFVVDCPLPDGRQSSGDGTEKLLFRRGGDLWEAVLMRDGARRTVCVSTQSGCGLGCRFCATATLGFRRNLTPGEIIGQILRAGELLPDGERVTNLVFMGMGEPLQNFEAVRKVLEIVGADWGLDLSWRHTTVSTVGLVPQIHEWANAKIKARLAISLIAADDDLRSELMPINRKYPLAELKKAAIAVAESTGRRVTFEYILMDGVNDSIGDAKKLVHFIHGIPCKINLIRFHPHPGSPYRRPAEERVLTFRDYLYPRCPAVSIRKSFGVDIDAACGQLAGRGGGLG